MEQFEELMIKISDALQIVEQDLQKITLNIQSIRKALE